jgi:hypothetical protein
MWIDACLFWGRPPSTVITVIKLCSKQSGADRRDYTVRQKHVFRGSMFWPPRLNLVSGIRNRSCGATSIQVLSIHHNPHTTCTWNAVITARTPSYVVTLASFGLKIDFIQSSFKDGVQVIVFLSGGVLKLVLGACYLQFGNVSTPIIYLHISSPQQSVLTS